jgi:hypothetical protein
MRILGISIVGVLLLGAAMTAPVTAAPTVTISVTISPDDLNPGSGFCAVQVEYHWTGFKNAKFDEVYVLDETIGVAYGIGYDANGNKLPNPLGPGQTGDAMGTLLYMGDRVTIQADLLARGGKLLAKSVAIWPTIDHVSCPV